METPSVIFLCDFQYLRRNAGQSQDEMKESNNKEETSKGENKANLI